MPFLLLTHLAFLTGKGSVFEQVFIPSIAGVMKLRLIGSRCK